MKAALQRVSNTNPYRVPIFNCIYELLLDDVPSMEQVMILIGVFAFLDAFMLSMAQMLMIALDSEQASLIRQKVQIWTSEQPVKLVTGETIDPYDRYLKYSCISFGVVTSSVLSLIVMWLGLGTINFNNKSGVFSKKAFAAWWYWGKWPIVMNLVLLSVGFALFVIASCYAWAMQHASNAQQLAQLVWWSDAGNYVFLLLMGTILPTKMLSVALFRREGVHVKLARELRLNEESAADVIWYVGRQMGGCQAQLRHIVHTVVEDNWLKTAADLVSLSGDDWKQLGVPLQLQMRITEELASEEVATFHTLRMHRLSSQAECGAEGGISSM